MTTRASRFAVFVSVWVLAALAPLPALAQDEPRYVKPPDPVSEFFDREREKNFAALDYPSPDGERFIVPLSTELSSLERMGRPTLRLAMLELRPDVHREWRLDTYGTYGLRIYSLASRGFTEVSVPEGILVSDVMWSHDGSRIAFLAHLADHSEVWTADARTGEAASLASAPVMATLAARPGFGRGADAPSRLLHWTPEGSVLALLVPERAGDPPSPSLPSGPVIRETRDKETPTPTYPFLLRDAHDKDLFRHHTTSQLAELRAGAGPRYLGEPGMFLELSLSPDGKYLLAERIVEPLSPIVSYTGFATTLEVLDRDGRKLATVRELPLREGRGSDDVENDLPRDVRFKPNGSTLAFVWKEEKEDEDEDADADADESEEDDDAPRRDRLMELDAPFDVASARTLVATAAGERQSFSDVLYSLDGERVFATVEDGENGKTTHRIVTYDLTASSPEERVLATAFDPEKLLELPGEILTRRTAAGLSYAVTSEDGPHAYLQGEGYREDFEPRPFIDRVAIADGSKTRVFEGEADIYEKPLVALERDLSRIVVSRESLTDFPDSYLVTANGAREKLTENVDPFPEITGVKRVDFEFARRDGLVVQGRISLPVGYREGERVPAMFWTYPREYGSEEEYQKDAIQDRNRNAFNHLSYLRWSDIWLSRGYALVHPDVPIIRKGNTYNDNYIQHLVDSLYGAIRKVDGLGYVDVDRIGHGGHSYGAFATANLLAHSPFFKAGIAGDGAYNRSLTPMGFQSERRFLWENPSLYLEMSPFFSADHIDTPLLMYHGLDDNNTGTFPIQSERMMQALTGLGKTAVLYMYPFESHGPRAEETYLDLWARFFAWFDQYVKEAGSADTATDQGGPADAARDP